MAGELFGGMDSERVKETLRRIRLGDDADVHDPDELRQRVLDALEEDPTTGHLGIDARVTSSGIVELTGSAPGEEERELAGELARAVPGAELAINRILVYGTDVPPRLVGPLAGSS